MAAAASLKTPQNLVTNVGKITLYPSLLKNIPKCLLACSTSFHCEMGSLNIYSNSCALRNKYEFLQINFVIVKCSIKINTRVAQNHIAFAQICPIVKFRTILESLDHSASKSF